MKRNFIITLLTFFIFLTVSAQKVFDIKKYGAIGDGKTLNTKAMLFHESFLTDASMQQLLDFEKSSGFGLGIREGFSTIHNEDIFFHGGSYIGFLSEVIYDRKTGSISFMVLNSDQVDGDYGTIYGPYMNHFPKKANDAGIERIVSPRTTLCSQSVAPVVVLKNFGSAVLTTATINYQVDNGAVQTFNWIGNIASGADLEVALPVLAAVPGNHDLKIWTSAPNGDLEGNLYNDGRSTAFAVSSEAGLPASFVEGFEEASLNVNIWSPNHLIAREWGRTELSSKSGNASLVRDNFENLNIGTVSYIDLPMLHLDSGSQQLNFSYAYSAVGGTSDALEVLVSEDCGATWVSLFNKEGEILSQGLVMADTDIWGYFPQTDAEWHTETISLDNQSGSEVLIRFKQTNNGGGALFLDDFYVGSALGVADLKKNSINVYPNPATDKVIINGLAEGSVGALYNLSGQKLLEVTISGDTAIDVSSLAVGVYFLKTAKGSAKIIKR